MKFECSTSLLRDAVQMLQPVCPIRTTLPVLANLLVKAEEGKLTLSATDLDISLKTQIAADVALEGETTIPVKFFLDALRRIRTETILISTDENNVSTLKAGKKVECSLRGLAPNDFPTFPKIESENSIELDSKEFAKMLKHTSYAISKDENRHVLNGICLSFGEQFDVVATDGRRLAKYSEISIKKEESSQLIIPTKSVSVIQQILGLEGTVEMRYTVGQIEINYNQTVFVTRLVDGHYPNYTQVIPKSCLYTIEIDKSTFLNAVNLAAVVTEKTKQSVIRLTFTENQLNIGANTAEIGEVSDDIEIKYSGEKIELAFNPEYLTDVCQAIEIDTIIMEISNSTSPAVIRSGENFICVVMPLRV